MTCIIATAEGVWGDRRITSDDGVRCPPMSKLASNHSLVAGFAGSYEPMLRALDAVRGGETDPKALARFGADGLVVRDGRIWLIDSKRAWLKPRQTRVLATGSGYAEALAYLAGISDRGRSPRDTTIRLALKYVAKVRTDCGDGIDCLLS